MALPKIKDIFFYAAMFMVNYPWISFIFFAIIMGLCVPGTLYLELATAPTDIWANPDGQLFHEQNYFGDNFGKFFRSEMVIFKPKEGIDDPDFDIIKQKYLAEALYFQLMIFNTTVQMTTDELYDLKIEYNETVHQDGYKNYTYKDLCWSALGKTANCTYMSANGYFQNNLTRLMQYNDTMIPEVLLCKHSIDPSQTKPCFDEGGIPVQKSAVFGQLTEVFKDSDNQEISRKVPYGGGCNTHKKATSRILSNNENHDEISAQEDDDDSCKTFTYKAKALNLEILLRYEDQTDPISEKWEKQAIQETARKFQQNTNTTFIKEALPDLAHLIPDAPLNLTFSYLMERSVQDEIANETKNNLVVAILSYVLMFLYIGFALGRVPSKYNTTFGLGFSGVILVFSSLVCGIGVISYLNIKSSLISAEVVPFLILAIGVDNMFIISKTAKNFPNKDPKIKIAMAIRDVGPSITVATIIECLTFGIGTLTVIPALKVFCLTAVFCLLFNYFFQMTVFTSMLYYDFIRRDSQRYDIICCKKGKKSETDLNSIGNIDKCFKHCYSKFILSKPTQYIVFLITLV